MALGIPGASWTTVPLAQAREHYKVEPLLPVHLAEMFGLVEPEFFYVHTGDLLVDGPLALSGEDQTIFVIDGDLAVNGPVGVQNSDIYTGLYVTGSVTVDDLSCIWDSQLFVSGALTVKGLLVTSLTDAGSLVVEGSVSAGTWLELADRGSIEFGGYAVARLIGREASGEDYFGESATVTDAADSLLPEFIDADGYVDEEGVQQALMQGRPVFNRDWIDHVL